MEMPKVVSREAWLRAQGAPPEGEGETLEELLAEDFTFTSPNDDDHISKDAYWKKSWPGSEKIRAIRIDKLFEKDNEAFVRYKCELKNDARFRNTECV